MTKIDFFNAALLKIGSQLEITGDDDESQEYRICERVWKQALKEVYSLYPWRCVRKFVRLNRYVKCDHIRFSNKFSLPADFLVLAEVNPKRTEYEIIGDSLYTNLEELQISYTAFEENVGKLTPHVYNCAVSRLACMIVPGLAKGSYNMKDSILQEFYQIDFNNAKIVEIRENTVRPPAQYWIDEE